MKLDMDRKKEEDKEKERKEILERIEKSLAKTMQMQTKLEVRKKGLTEQNKGEEKKQVTIRTRTIYAVPATANTNQTNKTKTKQNKAQDKQNHIAPQKQDIGNLPSKKCRIKAEKSAAKEVAKTAAAEAAKAAKEAVKHAEAAANELKEIEEMDSEEEGDDWEVAMGKRKARKMRKMSAESASAEDSPDPDTPPPKTASIKQKTLKDIQLESLVRSRMIEMRPKTEEGKFGDDGKINYHAFKNRFQSMTNVQGCNPFDALSEMTHWVKGNAIRMVESYQGAEDPQEALR